MTQSGVFAVVTGGGTSGHVLPALAIADGLVEAGHAADSIHYVGTTRGVERTLLAPTGYAHTLLDVVGLQRSLSPRNVLFAPKLLVAVVRAWRLLGRLRPRVVVNVGGYASFPASFAAALRRIPVVVVSYDRRPGLVSKLMARGATAVAVAFEGSSLKQAQVTGAPVRREIVDIDRDRDRDQARAELGLPLDRFVVAVCCGSLGAQAVNDAVVEAVGRLHDRTDLAFYHVVGDRNLAQAAPDRDGEHGILYRVIGYEHRMAKLYCATDLMITRGGAGTIAELATAGVPAIMVPWPGAAENHQVLNARMLSDVGAGVLLEQAALNTTRLIDEIERLRSAPLALAAIAASAYAAGAIHRSGKLVALIERVAA